MREILAKINKLSSSRYVRMAYNMLKSMAEGGKENWASAVRDLLCMNGFAFAWWNGSVGDETHFLTEFQQRLKDCFIQNWHSRLEPSGRYEAYKTFKSVLEKEKYLEVIQNQQIWKASTRFRLGIGQILTHKRRYTDENTVMLRCPLCNGETENEVHLLATCAWYDHIRQKYLSIHFDSEVFQYNCMHALATQHSSSRPISAMSIYIFYALRLRDEQISINCNTDLHLLTILLTVNTKLKIE